MLELGVIEELHNVWASPIFLVPKTDGSIRFCVDCRKVNAVSKFDAYLMPRVDELLDRLGSDRFYSTLDLILLADPLIDIIQGKNCLLDYTNLLCFRSVCSGLPPPFSAHIAHTQWLAAAYGTSVHWPEITEGGWTHANPRSVQLGRVEVRYLGFHLGHGQVRPNTDKTAANAACPSQDQKGGETVPGAGGILFKVYS